jgi:RNA-directed DNA polymerase
MPKCLAVSLAQIADWDNLVDACYKAAKGKHDKTSVQVFFAGFERSLQLIRQSILSAQLAHGEYRSFTIKDPKPRIIHAAPFADRVIHHALMNCLAQRMENSWLTSSYACRKGYGSHKAIEKAALLSRKYPVVIKLDIRAYFAHIHHDILLKLLSRQFKGAGLISLLKHILDSFGTNGTGIPIGALTSQYFANHYLDGYQRWLRQCPQTRDELRYMDDVLIFCGSLKDAKVIVDNSHLWLTEHRRLILKPAIIQYCRIGVTFCGFHVSSKGIKLGKRRKRSYQSKLKALIYQSEHNLIEPLAAQQRANMLASLCLPGEHKNWQRVQLNKYRLETINF